MDNDRVLLHRAVEIAEKGIAEGSGPFGAVITKNGKIISEASNKVVLTHDPTAHAEVLAIRKAAGILKTYDLSDCVIYTSCEPCPMCLGSIYWAGIKKVIYASDRQKAASSGFSDKMIYDELILEPEKRKIAFVHLPDKDGDDVFRKWDEFEGKIPY
ncbi:MAG: guanine deaminase [Bacteroidota bacterium]|nr:guanine deaminase [Bacteroidota bacterium]MDQ1332776.1 guanine deaminase [Bacteroidota bacterium]